MPYNMCSRSPDLRQDPFFIGRSEELNQIITNLLQNRHTLITGDRGIGKTRLMQEALSILNGTVHHIDLAKLPGSSERGLCIYIDSPAPLSKFMKNLASELMRLEQLKAVNAIKENELPQAILKAISTSGRKHIIFVDSLDTVTPSHHIFLERLLDVVVICGSSLSLKQQPVLKKIFDTFAVVPARGLPDEDSGKLIDYFVEQYKIRAFDRSLFKSQILKVSQGNPFQMKTFLHTAATKRFLGSPDIRELVYSANDRDYFNRPLAVT